MSGDAADRPVTGRPASGVVAAVCSALLLLAGVVALVVTGYRSDDPDLEISSLEQVGPWVVLALGIGGTAVSAVLLRARLAGHATNRVVLAVMTVVAALVVATTVIWAVTVG